MAFTHRPGSRTGLSEIEAWGHGSQPLDPAPAPAGDLAYNPGGRPFPRASASFTSRFDRVERVTDGVIHFAPNPNNRWTAFGSPNATDWVEIDFGREAGVGRVGLAFYDGGGVRAPADHAVEVPDGAGWRRPPGQRKTPERPAGGEVNEVEFPAVRASRLRVVFTHEGPARSGLTETLVWP